MTSEAAPLPLKSGNRLPALDGLRGLAVLLVLLDHASDAKLRLFPAADLNRAGKYGVYLFFVLSAFLLTHLLLLRPAELTRARTWLNYALRRFMRIFPLYVIVLVSLVYLHKLKWPDVFTHLALMDGKRQFWSIPVEVKYYFVLPFLVLTLSSWASRAWWRGALAALGALAVVTAIVRYEHAWSVHPMVNLSQTFQPFLFGSVAALAHRALLRRDPTGARFARWWEAAAVLALVVSFLRIPSIYNQVFFLVQPIHKLAFDPFVCGLLWSVLLLALLHGTGHVRRLMEWNVLRYLGLVSYSVYLWHVKFLTDVDDMPIPLPLRLLVFLLLVVGVGSVSYFLIERPLSRLRFDDSGIRAAQPTLPRP